MSLLKRAGTALSAAKDAAAENVRLVAQTTSENAQDAARRLSDEVRGRAAITKRKLNDALARPYPEGLSGVLDHLLTHEMDRIFLADAIASAEGAADEDTSWDEILKAALLDLKFIENQQKK